ncbi:hypothetical protein [uncultured Tateyamaria sp.]|uniref:hypothetical protein n=1 Tax=uncultured Tateyamaria sp. TaxID=455651 RepID=UPI0026360784|nr:hypothetical protein [uncultured Tateyamaria sp.]
MSDPMTNTEVEDVLASIRRLVSDDKRPESAPTEKPVADRLVLTPSLRVMEDDPVDDNAEAEVEAEQVEEVEFASDDEDQASDQASQDVIAEAEDDLIADEDWAETMPKLDELEDPDRNEPDIETPHTHDEAPFVHVEAEDDVWPIADGAANMPDPSPQEHADVVDVELEPEIQATAPEAEPATDHAQSLSDKIAALETLIGGRDDEFEPDDPGTDDYAGTQAPAMEWEDAEEPPVHAAFAEAPKAPAKDDQAPLFSSEDDLLDEDALRELVSDIVREELQGALGERITRNVRKLVRREIHRALAAQELE